MVRSNTAGELMKLVNKLQTERDAHLAAIEDIDRTFESLGIAASAAPTKRGRKKKGAKRGPKPKAGKRTRGKFKTTGEQSVIAYVSKNPGCTTKDVNKHWQKEGRAGSADNALTKLVKEKKLKRTNIKGQRGSTFTAK